MAMFRSVVKNIGTNTAIVRRGIGFAESEDCREGSLSRHLFWAGGSMGQSGKEVRPA
jgi:hypothetical protein